MFAGTSPSPEPGGIGLAKTPWLKIVANSKIFKAIILKNLIFFINLHYFFPTIHPDILYLLYTMFLQ